MTTLQEKIRYYNSVIRKIQEIVHGTITNFEQIQSFCSEESIITKTTKIGFGYAHDQN